MIPPTPCLTLTGMPAEQADWESASGPTPPAVEAAARALYMRCAAEGDDERVTPWPLVQPSRREAYRRIARVVLDAAERASC